MKSVVMFIVGCSKVNSLVVMTGDLALCLRLSKCRNCCFAFYVCFCTVSCSLNSLLMETCILILKLFVHMQDYWRLP